MIFEKINDKYKYQTISIVDQNTFGKPLSNEKKILIGYVNLLVFGQHIYGDLTVGKSTKIPLIISLPTSNIQNRWISYETCIASNIHCNCPSSYDQCDMCEQCMGTWCYTNWIWSQDELDEVDPIDPGSGGGGGGNSSFIGFLSYNLNLTQDRITFLNNNPILQDELYHYLIMGNNLSNNEVKQICREHINRIMNDQSYLQFVVDHLNSGTPNTVWWIDVTFLELYGGLNFGSWAINYLKQNPNINFSIFENQFMKLPEGQDENYDANYWDDPNLSFPFQNLPNWTNFKANYPKHLDPLYDTPVEMYTSIGGQVLNMYNSNSSAYQNTCAIRVSKALNYSGITITSGTDRYQGADGKYYFLSAAAIFKWMKKTFGTPTGSNHLTGSQGGANGQNFPALVTGKKGVYIMIPNFPGGCPTPTNPVGTGFCASGHADLIENGQCDGGCYFNILGGVHEIFIWELQ
jgi:hypothetical protein